jgi:hypothetical protein
MTKPKFARTLVFGAALCSSLCFSAPAYAVEYFQGFMSGAKENPPNASLGSGLARVILSDDASSIRIIASFTGLVANDTAAHIHCCALPTANAGVVIDSPILPGFPTGVMSGAYDRTLNLLDPLTYNPAFVTANGGTAAGAQATFLTGLRGGLSYFNVHTSAFPGGEIRSNLVSVASIPEPASWILMLAGFGLAGAGIRRKATSVGFA